MEVEVEGIGAEGEVVIGGHASEFSNGVVRCEVRGRRSEIRGKYEVRRTSQGGALAPAVTQFAVW